MPRVLYLLKFTVFLLLIVPLTTSAQIIQTIEESVDSGGNTSDNTNNNQAETSGSNAVFYDSDGYDDSGLDVNVSAYDIEALFFLARSTAYALFGVDAHNPFAVAENGGIEFADYPYDDPKTGLFRRPGEWGFRHRFYVGTHFLNNEQALSGGLLEVKYSPIRALSVDFNHLQLVERLEDDAENQYDWLGFSTLAVQYNRLRHHRVHAWWGLGASRMSGEENYWGPALLGGMTWYIKKPLSLHLEAQSMWFNGAAVQSYQARLQAHVKRFPIYAGYQGIVVGGNHFPAWTLGTGVWF